MISLTWPQVYAWRLEKHSLLNHAPREKMLDVIADIGGLHAQMMSAAELQAWARVCDLTLADRRCHRMSAVLPFLQPPTRVGR